MALPPQRPPAAARAARPIVRREFGASPNAETK